MTKNHSSKRLLRSAQAAFAALLIVGATGVGSLRTSSTNDSATPVAYSESDVQAAPKLTATPLSSATKTALAAAAVAATPYVHAAFHDAIGHRATAEPGPERAEGPDDTEFDYR